MNKNTLNFKILKIKDNYITKESQIKHTKFLISNLNKIDKNLLQFFGGNFFHDGSIQNIIFSNDMSKVEFDIACVNIKLKIGNDYEYINPIWFKCEFIGLRLFVFERETGFEESSDVSIDSIKYNICEINTLLLKAGSDLDSDEMNSIIINIHDGDVNMGIIFSRINVIPREPAAFELMQLDERFDVPLFKL